MRIRTDKKTHIWSLTGQVVSVASGLLLMPLMMVFVPEDYLGLWYVYAAIGAIVTLFDNTFAPALARNIAYVWTGARHLQKKDVAEEDCEEIDPVLFKKVLRTCRLIYLVISGASLVIMLGGFTWHVLSVSATLDSAVVIVSWTIYCAAVFFNMLYCYFSSFLRGTGDFVALNKATIISKLVYLGGALLFLLLDMGILGVSFSYFLSGFIFRFVSRFFFYRNPDVKKTLAAAKHKVTFAEEWAIFKILWYNSWREGLIALANYFASQVTTLIASSYLSLSDTGVYSISMQIISSVSLVAFTYFNTSMPAIQSNYVAGDKEAVKKLVSSSAVFAVIMFAVCFAGAVFVGLPILHLIKPTYQFNILLLGIMAVYELLYKHHSLFCSYLSCTNRLPYVWSFLISSAFGLLFTFLLMQFTNVGVYGLILGGMAAQLLFNNWFWPAKVLRELSVNYFAFLGLGTKTLIEKFRRKKDKEKQ